MSRRYSPRLLTISALVVCGSLAAPAVLAQSVSSLSPSKALSLESESGIYQTGTHESRTVCPVRITSQYQHVFRPGSIPGARQQITQQEELGNPEVAAMLAHRYARTVAWCYGHRTKGLSGDQRQAVKLTAGFLFTYAKDYDKAHKGEAGLDSSALAQANIGRTLMRSEPISPARNMNLAQFDKIIKAWDKQSHQIQDTQKKMENDVISTCVNDAKLGIDSSSCNKYPAYRAAVKAQQKKLKQQQAQQQMQNQSRMQMICMQSFANTGAPPPPQYHCSQFKGFTKKWKASQKRTCARMKAMKAPYMPPFCSQGGGS